MQELYHRLVKAKKVKIEEENSRCNFVLDFLQRQNPYPLEAFSSEYTQEDRMIHLFDHMKDLNYLSLRNCMAINDQVLSHIPSNCKHIDLSVHSVNRRDRITDKGILSLFNYCHRLESLDLYGRKHLSDKGFSKVNASLISLTLPGLYCRQITFKTIEKIEKKCPHLLALDLRESRFAIKTLKGFKHLRYLDLSFCANLQDVKFDRLPSLKVLNLKGAEGLSDAALVHLSENCPNLEKLYLSFCNLITDDSVCSLLEKMAYLEVLDLSRCTQLTSQIIPYLIKYRRRLKRISLIGCPVKKGDLSLFRKAHPTCLILS